MSYLLYQLAQQSFRCCIGIVPGSVKTAKRSYKVSLRVGIGVEQCKTAKTALALTMALVKVNNSHTTATASDLSVDIPYTYLS